MERSMKPNQEIGIQKEGERGDQPIWAVWVADPLTKDAETLLRWSKTSFYAGCPKPTTRIFEGKEHSLFIKSCNRDFAQGRCEYAKLYYSSVVLTKNDLEAISSQPDHDDPKPPDDLLGFGSSLCGGSC